MVPAKTPFAFPACPADPHVELPLAIPWQYCVTLLSQELPNTLPRKF
jgi:hypothetical protein